MATTIQHNPVSLQQQKATDDEDVVLATYLSSSLRFDHHQPQQQQQQQQQQSQSQSQGQYNNNAAYYYQQQKKLNRPRTRVPSNTSNHSSQIQVQKSLSTPIINNNNRPRKPTQQQQSSSSASQASSIDGRRRSTIPLNSERRPSIASTTSAMSIQSDMSINTKLSLTKRLRKVFSMNNLKSQNSLGTLNEGNNSEASLSSTIAESISSQHQQPAQQPQQLSFRRRSIASLSSLFQKGENVSSVTPTEPIVSKKLPKENNKNRRHSSGDLRQLVKEDENKKKPELRVDVRKGGLKVRSTSNNSCNSSSNNSITPDSPNSVISSRSSFSRLPPPQQQRNFIHLPETGLPSPTPSTSSSTKVKGMEEDYLNSKKASTLVGFHYGLGLHGSPKLKPASSSTSTLGIETRRIQFCSTIQVHETFSPADYDRRCDTNSTCQKLTHIMAMKIKQELNEYKLTDMEVHVESRQYTHFFL